MTNYPRIPFTSKLTDTISMKNIGWLVGDLIVGWLDTRYESYALYNQYGYRVVDLAFQSAEDTIRFAQLFSAFYGDYFILWEENRKASIPELTQWTINGGVEVLEAIHSMPDDEPITFDQFTDACYARLNS